MSYENWLKYLKNAEKNSMLSNGVRKVFYKFPDGKQMAEEYSLDTGVVQRRAWRKSKQLMGETEWEVELGEDPRQLNAGAGGDAVDYGNNDGSEFVMRESNTAPILAKRITKKNIEWRVRNMPYSLNVYSVQADPQKHAIVVRTSNKKYYKEIPLQELDRCGIQPEQGNITVHHQYNTLIITYRKPELLCEMEAQVLLLLKDVVTETDMEDLMQDLLAK